jgi:hypothetical protein
MDWEEGKQFFFEKKEPKNFCLFWAELQAAFCNAGWTQSVKVFTPFLQKRRPFLPLPQIAAIISLIRTPSISSENGLVNICIPGFRLPSPSAAFSA